MEHFICVTCGTQFALRKRAAALPHLHRRAPTRGLARPGVDHPGRPAGRPPHGDQAGRAAPDRDRHLPPFAIGQRALLVQSPGGNVLWDCISLIDEPTIAVVKALGGVSAIAISHPHYYAAMVEWSHAFGAPIYLHAADREHVMRPDPAIDSGTATRIALGTG